MHHHDTQSGMYVSNSFTNTDILLLTHTLNYSNNIADPDA